MANNLQAIRKVKAKKIAALRQKSTDPYPETSRREVAVAQVKKQFDELVVSQKKLWIAGRVMAKREHGGSTFVTVSDGLVAIQAYFKQDTLGVDAYSFFLSFVDIGDIIETNGSFFITRRGEQTQEVYDFAILAKAVLPLPEKWHGLQDVEERYRKRYLDLLMNNEVRQKFVLRSHIVKALRGFLEEEGFMEVETPILQTIPGGALARPFKTRLNALKMDLYLRVAPELYLKELLVGGYEKVYEIGRCFRNEGIDATHNPDFTMLECYAAYQNYRDFMALTERMVRSVVKQSLPNAHLQLERDGVIVDFHNEFSVVDFAELLKRHTGISYETITLAGMVKEAKKRKVVVPKGADKGKVADELYKALIRSKLIQPTFVINHPIELSPLAKQRADDPKKVSRFQLLVGGMEVVNGYSELNDPQEQEARFKAQEKNRKKGDEEAQRMDKDFIEALEYGMPPAAGLGVGIERLVALLTNSRTIREVMLFPTMRPKGGK